MAGMLGKVAVSWRLWRRRLPSLGSSRSSVTSGARTASHFLSSEPPRRSACPAARGSGGSAANANRHSTSPYSSTLSSKSTPPSNPEIFWKNCKPTLQYVQQLHYSSGCNGCTYRGFSMPRHLQTYTEEMAVKRAVMERDGYRCRDCGVSKAELRPGMLQVHRMRPGSRYTLKGCIALCIICHGRRPKSPYRRFVNGEWRHIASRGVRIRGNKS